jgi:hypothetical protein
MAHFKKILVFCVAAVLVLPVVLPSLLELKLLFIHSERDCRFEMENLTEVRLSVEDVHWDIAGKELRINGKLFDVKEASSSGKIMVFRGFFDTEESTLADEINFLWHNEKSGSLLTKCLRIPDNYFFQQETVFAEKFFPLFIHREKEINQIKDCFIEVPVPPPQALS